MEEYATDCTDFTHKSHILKAFVSRFAMFTDLKQPFPLVTEHSRSMKGLGRLCFFRINFKNNSENRICVNSCNLWQKNNP